MPRKVVFLLSLAFGLAACGGEPPATSSTPMLKVTRSVEIDAPPALAWQKIKDFDALHEWLPTIARTRITRGHNNTPGAVRLLTLKKGGTVEQELLAYDAAGMSQTWRIIRGVLPVSDYESTIRVEALGDDRSKVIWTGEFRRRDTGDKPQEGEDDKAAIDAIESRYRAGLSNLKKIIERGR
ncbi:MAG: SRPBCC family protein [Gammaproteobacteria bacterium]